MIETTRPYGFISDSYVYKIIKNERGYFIVTKSGVKIETTKQEYERWQAERT